MSLLDKATIITTPTAQSEGKLHSIKGGSVADFDVVRGSAATRVNAEGLIEDIRVTGDELILNGDFSNGSTDWTIEDTWTIGGGVADGNGANGSSEELAQNNTFTLGKTYMITYQVLNYSSGSIRFQLGGGGGTLNGTTRSSNGTFTEYVTATANHTKLTFRATNFVGSVTNVSVVEIIDATNIPRIDYSTGEGVILTEPQSTNLIEYSEDFSQWTASNATTTSNSATSPSGLLNANKVIASSANTSHAIFAIPSVSSLNIYTFSLYAKADEYERLYIRQGTGSNPAALVYELNGVGSVLETYGNPQDTSITNVGNGWYRITLTKTASGDNFAPNIMGIPNSGYTASEDSVIFLGDGTSGVYLWGAQLEQQSYATSYIPTNGAIATRLADVVTGAGDVNTFNDSEGVLYVEMAALANDGTIRRLAISDGSNANRVFIGYSSTSNSIQFLVQSLGVVAANSTFSISDITQFSKVAIKYKENDCSFWIDGVKVGTDTVASMPTGLSSLGFTQGDTARPLFGKVKSLITFDTALTDAELECLTTI